jgi:hypothetical protein
MIGRRNPADLAVMARLQELAVLESRRALEVAVADTNAQEQLVNRADEALIAAEASYAELHAEPAFNPIRMLLAGALLNQAGDEAEVERSALQFARDSETTAGIDWQRDRHRAEWFGKQAQQAAKFEARRRDDRAEDNARQLRLALGQGALR